MDGREAGEHENASTEHLAPAHTAHRADARAGAPFRKIKVREGRKAAHAHGRRERALRRGRQFSPAIRLTSFSLGTYVVGIRPCLVQPSYKSQVLGR